MVQRYGWGKVGLIASPSIPQLSPVSWQRWRIRLSGDDLGLWLKVNDQGNWTPVFSPTGNGQGILGDITEGAVGLGGSGTRCDYIKIGYSDGDNDGALDETIYYDDFDTNQGTPPLEANLAYDERGNLTDDGIYTYNSN